MWKCANGKAPLAQHVPAMLYYGYVTPFVNMSIAGFLWYQVSDQISVQRLPSLFWGIKFAPPSTVNRVSRFATT